MYYNDSLDRGYNLYTISKILRKASLFTPFAYLPFAITRLRASYPSLDRHHPIHTLPMAKSQNVLYWATSSETGAQTYLAWFDGGLFA